MCKPTHFMEAIRTIAPNDKARADILGVSRRTAQKYREGDIPEFGLLAIQHPFVLDALKADAATWICTCQNDTQDE